MNVIFGIGKIASKTIRFYNLNLKNTIAVDNDKTLWNSIWNNIEVKDPKFIKKIKKKLQIFICSTSVDQISQQIKQIKIKNYKIIIPKFIQTFQIIDSFEKINFDLYFASGLPSQNNKSGGGIYRIIGSFDNYKIKKIYNGNCHCIKKLNSKHFVFTDINRGIIEIDKDGIIKNIIKLKNKPHGLTFDDKGNYIVCLSGSDTILRISRKGKFLNEINIFESKNTNNSKAHMNDIFLHKGKLYISMFSLSGDLEKDKFNGGVISLSLKNLTKKIFIKNLIMPHNIIFHKNNFFVCDSFRGQCIDKSKKVIFSSNGFLRGLHLGEYYSIFCESKNRNFNNIKNSKSNISIDTKINFLDMKNKIFKSIQLNKHISEIHSIISNKSI